MYSPRSRVRFWEQEGHKWKTLQLKLLKRMEAVPFEATPPASAPAAATP